MVYQRFTWCIAFRRTLLKCLVLIMCIGLIGCGHLFQKADQVEKVKTQISSDHIEDIVASKTFHFQTSRIITMELNTLLDSMVPAPNTYVRVTYVDSTGQNRILFKGSSSNTGYFSANFQIPTYVSELVVKTDKIGDHVIALDSDISHIQQTLF